MNKFLFFIFLSVPSFVYANDIRYSIVPDHQINTELNINDLYTTPPKALYEDNDVKFSNNDTLDMRTFKISNFVVGVKYSTLKNDVFDLTNDKGGVFNEKKSVITNFKLNF